jgi:hypothetical protein
MNQIILTDFLNFGRRLMKIISHQSPPIYRTIGDPEIDNNPLLAHLRLPPENDDDAFLALGLQAKFNPSERELPTAIRRLRVNRLRRFFIPTQPVHRRALIGISSQMFDSYSARNPMTPEGQAILYGGSTTMPFRSTISFVTGHSGMGKSTLIDRVLAYSGQQICRHIEFRGESFPETQILWLRRNLPEQCTLSTLCSTFGDHTDQILRTNLYGGVFSKLRADRSLYLKEIRKIITNHHVGMLVLDEFQNLSLMGIGAGKILALLVNLRDELGVPIVVIGTYKSFKLLEGTMSSARRLCEGGYFDLKRPVSYEDEAWNLLCSAAWEYQWVRNPEIYSPEIADALYDVSQGITGIMLSVFITAQLAAMEDGKETVDTDLIRKVYVERMSPLHSAIRTLQSGDPRLMDKFDDIYRNAYPNIDRSDPPLGNEDLPKAKEEIAITEREPFEERPAAGEKSVPDLGTDPTLKPSFALTDDQIQRLVTADSIANLISLLDN